MDVATPGQPTHFADYVRAMTPHVSCTGHASLKWIAGRYRRWFMKCTSWLDGWNAQLYNRAGRFASMVTPSLP